MNYAATAASALKSIAKYGAAVTIRRTVPAVYNSGTGKNEQPGAVLDGAIAADYTTITLKTVTGTWLAAGGVVKIGSEYIYYAAKTGLQLTGCVRGYDGSTAAAASNLAAVTLTYQDFQGVAVISGYKDFSINGTSIKAGDKKYLLAASGLGCTPTTSDKVVDTVGTYSVINVEPVGPGGVTLLYKVQGRK